MTSPIVETPIVETSRLINYNVEEIRQDFPVLSQQIYGKPLTFLDSAASAQKPQVVLDAIQHYYAREYANIHRGVYYLSQVGTQKYEDARVKLQKFINARSPKEIIFVRGATEAINLVAQTYGRKFLKAGDEIILSRMEHHSNIVPWQILRDEKDLVLTVSPIDDKGNFLFGDYEKLLSERVKLVAITQISNALGTITPIRDIITAAHKVGAKVLVDGCQAVPHMRVDVQAMDADFYVFSGHKIYGPTGVGILYGREELLNAMPPYQGGGDMINSVTFAKTTYNDLPHKFEAGTPHIAGGIGLGVALDYVDGLGFDNIARHEQQILDYALNRICEVKGVNLIGRADHMAGIISFTMDLAHPHDIGTILDQDGIAIRTGHHCAQPVMDFFDIPSTARLSLGLYNTEQDIDRFIDGLHKVNRIFS
ncbi:MAG: cysteine desulfurase [Alphaproteobacteria bacterium]|nr:cysteine desulfurase [Alphaproteobacteria bacterium]